MRIYRLAEEREEPAVVHSSDDTLTTALLLGFFLVMPRIRQVLAVAGELMIGEGAMCQGNSKDTTSSGDNNRRRLFALLILVVAIVTALVWLEWPDRCILFIRTVFPVVFCILMVVAIMLIALAKYGRIVFSLLIYLVNGSVCGLSVTHDGIQRKYRYIYKVVIALLSYATIGLALYGFFVRALWCVQHGIAFMSTNRTEDIALIGLILLPTISGSAVLIAVALDYLRDTVARLKRDEECELSKTVNEANAKLEKAEPVGCWKQCVARFRRGRNRNLSEIVTKACAEVRSRKAGPFTTLYWEFSLFAVSSG
ncbi:hypothetical protein [Methylacidimicrobium sp. B4]|uniref:hypothetical protein n=1 Tax=Methylacidimicrobium sp. B4 TaxID=2796139 RepID=UPI001A8F674B|nr:hypothetical protein [Methylacidimicrobium sp. B4]QSR85244.1 hypothetical protein MacB4_03000 [Methylacidimicrobium sp. B4]